MNIKMDIGFGIDLEILETKTMGKIVIIDNNIENGIWNRKRQLLK